MIEMVESARYVPIDELLERPRVRILRALRRFDWITAIDLADVLDLPTEKGARDSFASMLGRLVRIGQVERRGVRPFDYRITKEGRADLEAVLAGERQLREFGGGDIERDPGTDMPGHFYWRGRWRKK